MKTKIFFAAFMTLVTILACGGPPSVSFPSPSNPTQALSIPTVPTSFSTPPPSIPDFEQVINFGSGGGGPPESYPGFSPAIVVYLEPFTPAAAVYLWGFHFNMPFQLQLISPDGSVFQSTNILVDESTGEIQWEGYPGFGGHADMTANPVYVILDIWWPNNFSSGEWHISVSGNGLQVSNDFLVEAGKGPTLDVLDTHPSNEIIPSHGRHPATADGTGKVVGLNYPPQVPVYLLLYHERPAKDLRFDLLSKQVVTSDLNGKITADLLGLFESDEQFLVIGVSDLKNV